MSGYRSRIGLIEALLVGSKPAGSVIGIPYLNAEIGKLGECTGLANQRRNLLRFFHTSRICDGIITEIFRFYNIYRTSPKLEKSSLGQKLAYLTQVRAVPPSQLSANRKEYYQKNLVDERNNLMHTPGFFPSTEDANKLINVMHEFIAEINLL